MGEKCKNPTFYGPKPRIGTGTGTKKWYRYPWCSGQVVSIPLKVVPVPIGSRVLVSVPVQLVPVLMFPTTLFLHVMHF